VCPVKNRGRSTNLSKLSPFFFTGRKLGPPGVGIEATGLRAAVAAADDDDDEAADATGSVKLVSATSARLRLLCEDRCTSRTGVT